MNFKYIVATIVIPLVFILDQLSKRWAVKSLKGGAPIDVIKGFFDLRYVENPGAAWGIFGSMSDEIRKPFFIVVSSLAILFIIYFFIKIRRDQRVLATSVSLILGGAFGNFYDRLINSYVVDFIHWFYKDYHWPTFNIADAAISCGVVLMIIHMLFLEKKESEIEKGADKKDLQDKTEKDSAPESQITAIDKDSR